MTTHKILTDALGLIDTPDKWAKGNYHQICFGSGEAYCMVGALNEASGGYPSHEVLATLHKAIWSTEAESDWSEYPEETNSLEWEIETINDLPQTCHSDVIEWFGKAIGEARKGTE